MQNESMPSIENNVEPLKLDLSVKIIDDRPKEPKNSKPSTETIIKIITTLIAVCGFIFGIYTFQVQQRTTQTQDFKMRLWEKKLEVYDQLAGVTGDIIIFRNDSLALDSLVEKFDKIYYSSLILVQNDSVEAKVRMYKDALADYRQNIKSILYLKTKQVILMKKIGEALKETQDFGE
ncbi:MAG TPA: hypothetical protein PLP23_16990 [Panacibacter sp.]|nr:hypothetical protein [Panacibacter sp.]